MAEVESRSPHAAQARGPLQRRRPRAAAPERPLAARNDTDPPRRPPLPARAVGAHQLVAREPGEPARNGAAPAQGAQKLVAREPGEPARNGASPVEGAQNLLAREPGEPARNGASPVEGTQKLLAREPGEPARNGAAPVVPERSLLARNDTQPPRPAAMLAPAASAPERAPVANIETQPPRRAALPAPSIRAHAPASHAPARSLAVLRNYRREDLFAIAEIGYHYLMNGAHDLARTIFEGLHAIDPRDPYAALALGLISDREGNKPRAESLYALAAQLDPDDPRPDLNRAELAIERGELDRAALLLRHAASKAASTDPRLAHKAGALLRHISGQP